MIFTYILSSRGGDILAFDAVKEITKVEKDGEEIIKKAQVKASEIQKKAQDEADTIIENAKKSGDEYYKAAILKYENEAKEVSRPIVEEARLSRKRFENIHAELMDSAVNMVIERIVNSHGNS